MLKIGSSGELLRTHNINLYLVPVIGWEFADHLNNHQLLKYDCITEFIYFSGIGASIATTQSEYLMRMYFHSRLPLIHTLHQVGQAVGEILMPVLIASLLTKFGLSSTLLLQAGITLQALIGAVLFRRPRYNFTTQKNMAYTLLQVCTSVQCKFTCSLYNNNVSIKSI